MGDFKLKLCDTGKEPMVFRYVVPFYVALYGAKRERKYTRENACYLRMNTLFDKSSVFHAAEKSRQESDAYAYLSESLLKDDPKGKNPGRSFTFDLSSLPEEYLDEQHRMTFRFHNKGNDKDMLVHMTELGIYYFRTNIGLLWYELKLGEGSENMDLEDLIYFQNKVKELHRADKTQFLLSRGEAKPKLYEGSKLFTDLLEELLALDAPDENQPYKNAKLAFHFFDKSQTREKKDDKGNVIAPSREVPDKALMFSYLLLDPAGYEEDGTLIEEEAEEELEKIAYYFSNGYTSRYHISPATRDRMMEPFEGVRWFAGRDGAGYYALRREDNQTFYENGLAGKIRVDYFLFYILALHQSFTVNNYQRRITDELSANPDNYLDDGYTGQKMEHLLAEINVFSMKSIYMSVSHVQHQNDFFEYLQEHLKIREDMETLSLGIESLTELARIQREDGEKENERKMNGLLGIISILAIVSALTDGTAVMVSFYTLLQDESLTGNGFFARLLEVIAKNAPFSIFILVFTVVLLVLLIYSIAQMIAIAKKNREQQKS